MADSSVRAVTTNQTDIYKNLEQVVRKYAATRFLRPIADHTREAFESAKEFIRKFYASENSATSVPASISASSPSNAEGSLPASYCVILDSGCGTGESTLHLARKFPGVPVIGIDKSTMRLNKAGNIHQLEAAGTDQPANAFWVRAELLDFWKLALEEVQAGRWQVLHHAVYYPNPWPKESEATRRFHLHPIFPTLMALGNVTELRTNWEIYAREFAEAARILQNATTGAEPNPNNADATTRDETTRGKIKPAISCEPFAPLHPETAFERKYKEAHQQLWRVLIKK